LRRIKKDKHRQYGVSAHCLRHGLQCLFSICDEKQPWLSVMALSLFLHLLSLHARRVSRNMSLIRKIRMIFYACVQSFRLIDFLNALSKRNRTYYRRIYVEKLSCRQAMITDKLILWLVRTYIYVRMTCLKVHVFLFPMWCARMYRTIKCIFIFIVNGKNILLFFLEKSTTEV